MQVFEVSDMFGHARTHLDLFGCILVRLDAYKCVQMRVADFGKNVETFFRNVLCFSLIFNEKRQVFLEIAMWSRVKRK